MALDEWQTIDTAPKDGRPIRVRIPNTITGEYQCVIARFVTYGDGIQGWNSGKTGDDGLNALWVDFTHWQPLLYPKAPSHNFLMLEVLPQKEISVAMEVDALVGMDSTYCPLYYENKMISRRARFRGRTTRVTPVISRYIFVTASFPRLDAILAIQGAVRFVLNGQMAPEVIPGWQMKAFQESVEAVRLKALRIAEKLAKPEKPVIVKSFAELAAQMKAKGEIVDPETGEITEIAA